nr:ABC transporter permease [uncultured Ruminococcus sp.]
MFQIAKEHKGFGKQILLLAKNELIKKYKGAVIGPLWSVVKPLFTLFVYWFAFEIGLKSAGNVQVIFPELGKSGGTFEYSRFLFMLIGFIPWFFINESIVEGAKSIRLNRQFVNKVSFPVSTIMTYTSVARLYVHIFLTVLMYIYVTFVGGTYKLPGMEQAVTSGIAPSVYNLQILFYMPLMFIFFLVLSWSTAPMSAFSRDFENMIISVMSGIFWLSGIIYDSYLLAGKEPPADWLRKLMLFNPINFFANGYRNCFLYHRWFWEYKTELIIFLAELVIILALGIFNYNRLRKRLPDVL